MHLFYDVNCFSFTTLHTLCKASNFSVSSVATFWGRGRVGGTNITLVNDLAYCQWFCVAVAFSLSAFHTFPSLIFLHHSELFFFYLFFRKLFKVSDFFNHSCNISWNRRSQKPFLFLAFFLFSLIKRITDSWNHLGWKGP